MQTDRDFIFLVSKITADGDCSQEIKRQFLLGRKVVANLASILKSRHHFADKGPSSQSYVFFSSHVWMWEWTIKKAEHQRIYAFKLWYWRNSWVPWTARRLNQSILKEINSEYSLVGLILKLKLQHSGHLMWKAESLEKPLMLGKVEGRRRRGQQRMRWLDIATDWMHLSLCKLQKIVKDRECCSPWSHKESDTTEWLNNNKLYSI